MTPRLNIYKTAPDAVKPLLDLEAYVKQSGLEPELVELVKTRASQINGCAFCLHMHTRDARKQGETEERLYLLDAWRESPLYSERERAALAWTEALTLVARDHVPDAAWQEVSAELSEREIADLTMLVVAINGWNRIAIGFRALHPTRKTPHATA